MTTLTRSALLRTALPLPGALAIAACGAGQETATLAKPAAPIEIEYWSTLQETHPEGKGRMEAMKVSQQNNADYVRIRFERAGGSNMDAIVAAAAGGTPPNLLVDRPNNAAMLFDVGIAIEHAAEFKSLPQWQKVRAAVPASFIEGATWQGKQVALPLYIVNQAMMYAPDLLERAGIRPPRQHLDVERLPGHCQAGSPSP